jgi:GNAT superfamily N-acetyltransferase
MNNITPPIKTTPAKISDAKEMHRIHEDAVRTTCKGFYSKEQIEAWLEGRSPEGYHEAINKGDMYVAEDNGKMLGFGHAIPGEILAIFVDPNSQKKGVGKLLLDHGLKIALTDHKKVKVESTINAEGFYKKYGFVKIRDDVVIKKGIEAPIVVMEYSLTKQP